MCIRDSCWGEPRIRGRSRGAASRYRGAIRTGRAEAFPAYRCGSRLSLIHISEQVLAAQQHLQLGVLDVCANGAQALPWVLVQVAQAAVERGAAPDLERLEAASVSYTHLYSYREHWQPKGIDVVFKLCQIDFAPDASTYSGYWERYPQHWV